MSIRRRPKGEPNEANASSDVDWIKAAKLGTEQTKIFFFQTILIHAK